MKTYFHILCLLAVAFSFSAFSPAGKEPEAICLPAKSSAVLRLAASEAQKYIYQRTGKLLPLENSRKGPSLVLLCDSIGRGAEDFSLDVAEDALYIRGGSDVAVLYGVYQYAELLGVRFTLHGDILPDERYCGSLLLCGEKEYKPLLAVRGLLPFHDFPEGPDLWTEDMYKSCLTQMVKMKLNFLSLHTYPHIEPNVWIGLKEDGGKQGDVLRSYPTTLANTSRPGAWGYSAMDTREYSCGASLLFPDSVYASPLLDGCLPFPIEQEGMNTIFNRTGHLLNRVFSFGKQLGVSSCVGLETPLSIPKEVRERLKEKGMEPDSKEAKTLLYEGIFSRIEKAHPLDYFWLWTPEEWTWGTPSEASVRRTLEDVQIARDVLTKRGNPFGFGLSGWVLGPPSDPTLFDRHLPAGDFLSSLSRLCGQERIDLGYASMNKERLRYPVLWLEDDPALTTPQFWAGRLRSDIAESYAMGCRGVIGNFWRTRSIAPNIKAFADACWQQWDWNPDFGKEYEYVPSPVNDIRRGGVGANYFRHIKGTEDQYLYNTQRYDLEGYKVKVPNGTYRVTFLFCETKYEKPGERVFDICLNGFDTLPSIDVFKAVGRDSVYALTSREVKVDNYTLDIAFRPQTGPTFLSAFIIEGRTADANQVKGTPYKRSIDVGGGLYKDFEADLSESAGNKSAAPRDLSSSSLYLDYAIHEFGKSVAPEIASLFEALDGTTGSEGHLGFRMPRPTAWITGPGVIQPNENDWKSEQQRYAFVDSLLALCSRVEGKGNRERYDYWVNTFCYLREIAHLGCLRGQLDRKMQELNGFSSREEKVVFAGKEIVPLRFSLNKGWETMMGYLLQTVSTSGEVGTVINLESQTRMTYRFLTKYDSEIRLLLSNPPAGLFELSGKYAEEPRLIMLNKRGVVTADESYRPELIVLGDLPQQTAPVFMYRKLGSGTFKALKMVRKSGNIFSVSLPETDSGTLEYYITLKLKNQTISWPVTAPVLNETVVCL